MFSLGSSLPKKKDTRKNGTPDALLTLPLQAPDCEPNPCSSTHNGASCCSGSLVVLTATMYLPSRAKQPAWAANRCRRDARQGYVPYVCMEIHPVQCNEFDLCGVMPTIVARMVRGFYWLCVGWLGWPLPSLHLPSSSLSPPPFAAAASASASLLHCRLSLCLSGPSVSGPASGFNRLFPSPSFAGCSYVGLAHARIPCTPWSYLPSLTVTRSSPDRLVSSLPPLQSYPPTRTCRPSLLLVVDVVSVKHTPVWGSIYTYLTDSYSHSIVPILVLPILSRLHLHIHLHPWLLSVPSGFSSFTNREENRRRRKKNPIGYLLFKTSSTPTPGCHPFWSPSFFWVCSRKSRVTTHSLSTASLSAIRHIRRHCLSRSYRNCPPSDKRIISIPDRIAPRFNCKQLSLPLRRSQNLNQDNPANQSADLPPSTEP